MSTDTQSSAPDCPFPCGWQGLHKIAVQDAAYLAKVQWPEDEEGASVPRATAMRCMDYLIQVCRTMLNAAPAAAQAQPMNVTSHEAIDWTEISKRGLLERINREIMHPLGLAVYRCVETGVSGGALVSPDGVWTYEEDSGQAQPAIRIVFSGEAPKLTFVEVEDGDGRSTNIGRWIKRNDGLSELVLDGFSCQAQQPVSGDDQFRDAAQMIEPSQNGSGFMLGKDRAKRIYIAGPMTGIEDFNFPAFNAAAQSLIEDGWHVENPADHGVVPGAEWEDYLAYDLTRLGTCGAIYLLPGWQASKGATLEVHIARALGMEVFTAKGAIEPSGNSGELPANITDALDLMDAILAPERGLLSVPYTSATVTAAREDMALIRAALAQQDADIEAAAKTLAECMDYPWEPMPEQGRDAMRKHAKDIIDAARKEPDQ